MSAFFLTLGTVLKWLGFAASPLFLLPILVIVAPDLVARPARGLIRLIDGVTSSALHIAMWLGGLMVLAQLLVIVGRYVFDWSASWANETIVYSFAGLFLLAAGSALRSDAHVRVDILREKMNPKQRARVDLAGLYLFLFPICILILWAAISPSFVRSWAQFEGSRESDGLPIKYIFRTLVPLFAVLLMTSGLGEALRAAFRLRGLDAPAPPAADTASDVPQGLA